jgi:hypothetical protein
MMLACGIVFTIFVVGYIVLVYLPYYIRLRNAQRDYIREVHPHMTNKEIDELRKILF